MRKWICIAILGAATLLLGVTGPIVNHPVYVLYTSFGLEFPENPTRVIDLGLGAWAEYGGAHKRMYVAGSTTTSGCSTVSNLYAIGGICHPTQCPTTCNCVAGAMTTCGNGTVSVALNTVAFNFLLGDAPGGTNVTLQGMVGHEFGHSLQDLSNQDGYGHVVPLPGIEPCLMTSAGGQTSTDWYFCDFELSMMDSYTGHASAAVYSSAWSPGTGWSIPAVVSPSLVYHWGTPALERGSVVPPNVTRESIFYNNGSGNSLFDYRPLGGPYAGPAGTASKHAQTIVYNPTDNLWVLFALEPGVSKPRVLVYTTPDRVNWTFKGHLREQSFGATIRTRSPVAAAYDPVTNTILAVVTGYEHTTCSPFNTFGCVGTMNAFVLFPATGYNPVTLHQKIGIHTAFGAAAVVCGTARNASGHQCAVAVTGVDNQRSIWFFDIGITNYPGSVVSFSGAWTVPGATNMQMSAHALPSGPLLLVVTGTNSIVYATSRTNMSSGWTGFSPVFRSDGNYLTSKKGPRIRAASFSPFAYDMLVVP